ncbi:MAG TPA: alcohol dehydrogenase catalytic domain-containing protein, partial [Rubrivivax sp.]|nr:alcohol dehydrogenase catalytic domain-containing protein [Rubrivivax sp.]
MSHRAWICSQLSADFAGLRLEHRPTPRCGPGEVRVRVRAAALNFPDLLMSQGKYQHRPPLPFVAGMECAGEVVERDAGVDWPALGDAVCFGAHAGAFTEQLVAPASALRPLPRG